MPGKSRIDAFGALHHIIASGIECSKIFRNNTDCNNSLDRLGGIIKEANMRPLQIKFSPSLRLNKIEHFSKVSICVRS